MNSHPAPSASSTTSASSDNDDVRRDGLGETLSQLSRDVASLKNTFALLAAQVGDAASGVADTSSDLATSARQHAKTFASELEAMARRNPLGTIAGTLVVGVIVGMMTRGRG